MIDKIYPTQDPKYGIQNNRLVNMQTGIPIPEDEPVFLFRAKDRNAADTLRVYLSKCRIYKHACAVEERLRQFVAFAVAFPNRMQEPTTERELTEEENASPAPVVSEIRSRSQDKPKRDPED